MTTNTITKKIFYLLCGLVMLLGSISHAFAETTEKTVKVGWFPFSGYQEYDENGKPYGYNYEYLNKIAAINHWKYEFVDGSRAECTEMLENGEIDILGCMLSTPQRRETFDFPQLDCGSTCTSLFVRSDSGIGAYDFKSFQGMTVGCCMSTKNDEDFLAFAKANGFTARLVDYTTEPDLVMAVLNGQVDAGIACSRLDHGDISVVASFSPEPFYFVTTKGNVQVLSGLNTAINKIKIENAYYEKELAVRYNQTNSPNLASLINQLPAAELAIFSAFLFLLILVLLWLVIKRTQSLKTIKKLTYFDGLTGMYNKRGFEEQVKELLSKAPSGMEYAIVALDIVAFRHFNEFNGIVAGDRILKAVGTVAAKELHQGEVGARLSADDFCFLMHARSKAELEQRVLTGDEHFRKAINNHSMRISYGIYPITDRSMDIQYMYDYAGFAMKSVDISSDNRIAFFDNTIYNTQKEKAITLSQAEDAFANKEFVPYYQPKFDTVSEKIVGAEALVRWVKPDGSVLSPASFVDLFEQNGYITRLDFYIFEMVCQSLADQLKSGLHPVPVSVNFSRAHLFNPAFPDLVADIAESYQISPGLLEIELTESAFTLESEMLYKAVAHLHEHGFSVAIDDFGSGYSSLGLLKDIYADTLKLDMRFMKDFEKGGRVGTVVTAVVHMANWLGMPVVAEGVETKEQADFIRSVGGDMIQGYYYAKPMPICEYICLLKEKQATAKKADSPMNFMPGELSLLMGGNRMVSYLLNGLYVAFGFYEYMDGKLAILRVNDRYLSIMGSTNESVHSYYTDAISQVYEPDRESFTAAIKRATETGKPVDIQIRRHNDAGRLLTLEGNILPISGNTNSALLCIFFHHLGGEERFCALPPVDNDFRC